MVCELWRTGDVVGYLYQLLRDNRGGQRVGFALPVVEEILFLVELKETSNRIE
jgi:S1-C subfamily serine protease